MNKQVDPDLIGTRRSRKQILEKLRLIEQEHDVQILFAVESGSRAWGFPSPDSDYDARFVYARSVDWYLSIDPGRDVIELPIEGDLDINGWDIQKALGLLLKPNPVLLEWLSSPVRYHWNGKVCDQLISLSRALRITVPACTTILVSERVASRERSPARTRYRSRNTSTCCDPQWHCAGSACIRMLSPP